MFYLKIRDISFYEYFKIKRQEIIIAFIIALILITILNFIKFTLFYYDFHLSTIFYVIFSNLITLPLVLIIMYFILYLFNNKAYIYQNDSKVQNIIQVKEKETNKRRTYLVETSHNYFKNLEYKNDDLEKNDIIYLRTKEKTCNKNTELLLKKNPEDISKEDIKIIKKYSEII